MGKRRCPNCGRRAPDGVVCCRNCGHSIPIGPPAHVRISPLRLASGGRSDESAAGPADELSLLVAECPACGRQAQRGWSNCPWCLTALPAHIWQRPEGDADPDEEGPPTSSPTDDKSHRSPGPFDEYIDDPELLEQAEEDVRRLPLRLPFTEPIEDPTVDKVHDRPVGWE